jgi:hypothetical protein
MDYGEGETFIRQENDFIKKKVFLRYVIFIFCASICKSSRYRAFI